MIYLLRHFKVKDSSKKWLNSQEFNAWVKDYDNFDIEYIDIDIPKDIDNIYVSSQNRAVKTAKYLKLSYYESDLLVEVGVQAFVDTKCRFPTWFWLFMGRLLWYCNLTPYENRDLTLKRVDKFLKNIDLDKNILIITHGFFMKLLVKQLKKSGFDGTISINPKNGTIYNLCKA